MFLSVMLFISWLVWRWEFKAGEIGQVSERVVFISTGCFTLASFLFFAFVPLPRAYYPEFLFHRPEEFVPAIFFLAALWGYLHKGAWRNDGFEHWLVLSLIVGVVGQVVFMSFSGQLFDMEFDAAHILKKVSYVCVLTGLLISMYAIFRREAEAVGVLEREVNARMRVQASLKRKAGELARSNAELEQFASVAAHDLQEPLRKVLAFSDRLQSKYADKLDDRGVDYLNRMQQSANRMKTLIEDLLAFSRVATKGQGFIRVDLNQIAQGVVSDMEIAIRETGAVIKFDDLPTIDADPLQMRQLFQNLLSNALKYCREDVAPDVKIESTSVNGENSHANGSAVEMCQIVVSDNGIGFDEEYAERIFGIFQRLHGRNDYKGSGIGLAICRKISDRHGGRIVAESRNNQGSKFFVTLPIQHGEEERNAK
jgi:signal transduction histidine kinase